MNTNQYEQEAHEMIDHIFQEILPNYGMAERPAQIKLSHEMLEAMLGGKIALCDAGTGIGKTYAYLVAGAVADRCRGTKPFQPILISTSSIALQSAVQEEYLPKLSHALLLAGLIDAPLQAVVRKGKSHYVCDKLLGANSSGPGQGLILGIALEDHLLGKVHTIQIGVLSQ